MQRNASFNTSPHFKSKEPICITWPFQSSTPITKDKNGIKIFSTKVDINSLPEWPKAIPRAAATSPNLFLFSDY